MCAIVDANAASEVFGSASSPAGKEFLKWINQGKVQLVAGGKLLQELGELGRFREWARNATLAGSLKIANESEVNSRTEQLVNENVCRSDDPHVVALAQVSGARLLYSNDKDLHRDLRNENLVPSPRVRIYSTNDDKSFTRRHQKLLRTKNLCRPR